MSKAISTITTADGATPDNPPAAATDSPFVGIFEQLTKQWAALPDSDPLFDGGRRLLRDLQQPRGDAQ